MSKPLYASAEMLEAGWLLNVPTASHDHYVYAYRKDRSGDSVAGGILQDAAGDSANEDVVPQDLRPGFRRAPWSNNCVVIGSGATSFEPLEANTLGFSLSSILRLLRLLPRKAMSPTLAEEFNRQTSRAALSLRDYQLLRYVLAGSRCEFYDAESVPPLPVSLRQRLDLFMANGRFTRGDDEVFTKHNWIASLLNLGAVPGAYDPLADMVAIERVEQDLATFAGQVEAASRSF